VEPGSEVVVELEPELEPNNADKPEPAVVDEPELELEIGEHVVETSADLSAKLVMELVPLMLAVRVTVTLRSPDLYDLLQIFLQEIGSHEIMLFMVRSTLESVLIQENVSLFATCTLLELTFFISDLSRKSVSLSPPWLMHDASVLIFDHLHDSIES